MRKRIGIIAVVAVMLASLAGIASAAHVFPDVPDTHTFHEEIGSIAAAGITTGFADGTYRPADNVTRQAMAAFMERGYTRLWVDDTVNDVATGVTWPDIEYPAVVGMEAGAASDGGGYVYLQANGLAAANSGCPCILIVEIVDLAANVYAETLVYVEAIDNFSLAGAANLPADGGNLYGLEVELLGSAGDQVSVMADMTAMYVPFDAFAENTFTYPAPAPLAGLDGHSVDDFQPRSNTDLAKYQEFLVGLTD